jgi:asparagine synthase (glutamine-hydrolysing)
MSVQAGIWNFGGVPVDREYLTSLGSAVREYGPDGESLHIDGSFGLLYRPLHTTRDSLSQIKPYVSGHELLSWDGRLDNRDDLAANFATELSADRSDTAVVAAGMKRWGTEFLAKVVGDWALCLWDSRRQELLLARDYIGIKNLFYLLTPTKIVWCSHLAALAQSGQKRTLCDEYCKAFLTHHPDAHVTPYREILAVPPGSFIRIRNGQSSVQRYWCFGSQCEIRYKHDTDYEEHFRVLFRQSLRRRLNTDYPILAGLSGGLDSSSIVCMADNISNTEKSVPSVDTFSFCDRDEPEEDDFLYFAKVEERRGRTGHHAELRATGDSLSLDDIQSAATPGFGERRELQIARSEVIAQGKYRVLLSGIGGDEFSGQALDFRVQLAELLVRGRLGTLARQLTQWSLITRRPWIHLFWQTALLQMPAALVIGRASKERPWLNSQLYDPGESFASSLKAGCSLFWKPALRDAERTYMTMARQMSHTPPCVYEIRYPFLDQNLIEFLTAIPTDQLLRPGERRSLMRRALHDLLPAEILARKTKAGAGRCVSLAINKHWSTIEDVLQSPLTAALGYTKSSGLRDALAAVRIGKITPYFIQLLRALSLEFWLRGAVERGAIAVPSAVRARVTLRLDRTLHAERIQV